MDTMLAKIIVGLPRIDSSGKKQLKVIARFQDDNAMTESYEWVDGKPLFETSTKHIRKLQHVGKGNTHVSIAKWLHYTKTTINPKGLWRITWFPYLV